MNFYSLLFRKRLVNGLKSSMEQAKYKLTINKDGIGCGLAYVSAVCQVAVVILLGVLILNDMIPLATFMGTGTICAGVYNGLNQVSKLAVSFSASKPYFDKITIHAGEAQLPDFGLPTLQEGITVKDVSFGYDEKKPILVHMNAEFKKGGKYALTGPSGCGKSTLLKILLGWLPGYQGKVLYDERDVRDYTPEQLQQKMSYIEQNVFLFNTTIRENITLGEHFTDEQMEKALRDSALAGDLANMPKGLDTPVGEEGNALSGGQKQRVAIARALATNPQVLLCDEATSALDPATTDSILTLIKDINKNLGITAVIITHEMSVIEKICSHVAIINRGKIVEHGEVEEVFFHPRTEAARRLVMPEALQNLPQENLYRLIFNGRSSFEPVIANMVLECHCPVNIMYADTRDINGIAFGQMVLQLPECPESRRSILEFAKSRNILLEEMKHV